MTGVSLGSRPGWLPALGAVALSVVVGIAAIGDSVAEGPVSGSGPPWWLTSLTVAGAVGFFLLGLLIGSDRLVGFASIPLLIGAAERIDTVGGALSGRPLIIGCLWFVAVELAWASIERRDEVVRPAVVDRQQAFEVAAVVGVSIIVGLAAILVAPLAPTRTLLVRGTIVAIVLALMAAGVRQLRNHG